MSLCINTLCSQPQNSEDELFCEACESELLLQGQYRVSQAVGQGGFGKTYELSGGDVPKILKVLINSSPKAVELFKREAKVLRQINHSGVPKVERGFVFHAKGNSEPIYCMILEKIPGINLRQYMEQRDFRPIDEAAAKKWLLELAKILDVIHGQGLLHRDIKPSNVMLKPDGKLALIDFGAVKEGDSAGDGTETATATGGTETATRGTSIYSMAYAPQEQILGHAIKQSDIFSLGRTIIFLLTGKEPSAKDMYNPLEDRLEWQKFSVTVSSQFATLIEKMNARSPKERPDSLQKILNYDRNPNPKPASQAKTIKPSQSAPKPSAATKSSQSGINQKMIWGFGGLVTLVIGIIIYGNNSSQSTRDFSDTPTTQETSNPVEFMDTSPQTDSQAIEESSSTDDLSRSSSVEISKSEPKTIEDLPNGRYFVGNSRYAPPGNFEEEGGGIYIFFEYSGSSIIGTMIYGYERTFSCFNAQLSGNWAKNITMAYSEMGTGELIVDNGKDFNILLDYPYLGSGKNDIEFQTSSLLEEWFSESRSLVLEDLNNCKVMLAGS